MSFYVSFTNLVGMRWSFFKNNHFTRFFIIKIQKGFFIFKKKKKEFSLKKNEIQGHFMTFSLALNYSTFFLAYTKAKIMPITILSHIN